MISLSQHSKRIVAQHEEGEAGELHEIEYMRSHLQRILQAAEQEHSLNKHIMHQLVLTQEHARNLQQKYEEMLDKCQALQTENAQLKASCSRNADTAKQWQRKEALLKNKIAKLTLTITEKQAVIKYLEQKQQAKTLRSMRQSAQDSQSSLSDSPSVFVPLLNLDNLARQKPQKQPTFHDFMPSTTRSHISECLRAENTAPSVETKQERSPYPAEYENYQSQPRRTNVSSQRHWNHRKSVISNCSSLLMRNCSNRQPSQYVSAYSSSYFNRYSVATARPISYVV